MGSGPLSSISGRGVWIAGILLAASSGVMAEQSFRRGPKFVHVEPSGALLVVCHKSGTVARVDSNGGAILVETSVGEDPFMLAAHPDGERLYVSCRGEGSVVELDAASLAVLRRFPVRGDPTGVSVSDDGRALYVAVHSMDAIAVLDIETGSEIKRLSAGNGPEYPARDPKSGHRYFSNLLSSPVAPDRPPVMEITVIDDKSRRVVERIEVSGAMVGKVVSFTHDGSMALVAATRPRNLVPFTQVARGWCVGNGFVVLRPGRNQAPVMLLVDQLNRAFADSCGIAILPDDRKAYLTCSASDTVIVLDLGRVAEIADKAATGEIADAADHLGLSRQFVTARVPVGIHPVGITASADGRFVYVANRLADSITVIDTATDEPVTELILGTPPPPSNLDLGERYFHTARASMHGQIGCITCHPDTGFDGLTWDLEPDGLGTNPLDNRNLRGIAGTAPFKWNGKNPDIATQCGSRTAKWIFRTQGFSTTEVSRLAQYIRSLRSVENPYRRPDGGHTDAQRRGKAIFESAALNDGTPIAVGQRCTTCHGGEKYSNHQISDVGTRGEHDTHGRFDAPHLINVFESGPYLHDGRAATLEEIWTVHNPQDRHGISSDWTQQQLNDLVEYLKSL